ncbi:ATP-binding protein [Fervidibacillus halotolerans]|uniref:histidine kinase n=1 Tax=Fervidibacillus halotolerans TaxID=2980027 RepID=A0A9E8M1Q7_9BACI|nr:ATP-binding protein [Fervidibacillus halotolerans]WAA13797.1 ATP-binding protein [Fervidibacillus halotolerans]
MIWRSIVGKLWATILLLVSIVLFVLSLLLMQFFRNYIDEDVTETLTNTASKIALILERHDDFEFSLDVAWEITDDLTKVIVITPEHDIYYSPGCDKKPFGLDYFLHDSELSRVFTDSEYVKKEILFPADDDSQRALMIGVPYKSGGKHGGVFIFQSLDVMNDATIATTKLIWWAIFLAFVLTTVFAFFLSTRITAPLRKMRQAAFEVTRGKFDTKVPILTNDELGELATAFNEMGKQLKINISALNQEKEQLANILSSMADGVLTFNREGKILVTNPPAEKFLHIWNGNQGDAEVLPSKIMELFKEAVETETEQVGDLSKDYRYWTVIVSPLYDNNTVRGAVAVVRDMTEERKLEKLRTDFVANVSHELRTPVAMLQGYSEALLDDVASTEEERKELAKIIHEESMRMGRLVNELLDLAKMESGRFSLNKETIQIAPFFKRIVKKFSGMARDKQRSLILDIQNDGTISMDEDRIEQVLTNLIDNAIRHTKEEGKVIVKANLDAEGLTFAVTDNGSGIAKEDLPFVFERFYKGDKARTRGKSGTGLGLAIAKNIVEAHNGKIEVQSIIGQGTTFTVFIPQS